MTCTGLALGGTAATGQPPVLRRPAIFQPPNTNKLPQRELFQTEQAQQYFLAWTQKYKEQHPQPRLENKNKHLKNYPNHPRLGDRNLTSLWGSIITVTLFPVTWANTCRECIACFLTVEFGEVTSRTRSCVTWWKDFS